MTATAEVARERHEHLELAATSESVNALRHQIEKTLADWGISERTDEVLLVGSELLTNAQVHGKITSLSVDLCYGGGRFRIEVTDANPSPLTLTVAGGDDEHGRGVLLVAAFADAWGFHATRKSKTAFAEFEIDDLHPETSGVGDAEL